MSTTSKFMERIGQRVRTRDVVPVSSGSPARLSLSFLHGANTPEPPGFSLRDSCRSGRPTRYSRRWSICKAFVTVPCVDDLLALKNELSSAGMITKVHAPRPISVREVRDRTKLSQEAFSVRYGLDLATASKLGARSLETGCSGEYSPLDHRPESGSSRRIAGHGGRSGCPIALRGRSLRRAAIRPPARWPAAARYRQRASLMRPTPSLACRTQDPKHDSIATSW